MGRDDLYEVSDAQPRAFLGQLNSSVLFPQPVDLTIGIAPDGAMTVSPTVEMSPLRGEGFTSRIEDRDVPPGSAPRSAPDYYIDLLWKHRGLRASGLTKGQV